MLYYACPDCGTRNRLHSLDCEFESAGRLDIERAYIDILSYVLGENAERIADSVDSEPELVMKSELQEGIEGEWDALHRAVYGILEFKYYIREHDDGTVELIRPEERKELRVPSQGAIQVVWEYGTVPGCHDNGIFALIAWHAAQGFSWEETRQRLVEWFHRTETWERGGFAENSPQAVLEEKHHVYESEYGWKSKAQATKHVLENDPRIPI